jgi:hypothetical protein
VREKLDYGFVVMAASRAGDVAGRPFRVGANNVLTPRAF